MADDEEFDQRKSATRRVLLYFLSIIALIAVANTPFPRFILSALFGGAAGESLAGGLRSSTRDLFLLLLVSLYFEWAKSRENLELLQDMRNRLTVIRKDFDESASRISRSTLIDSLSARDLIMAGLGKLLPKASPGLSQIADKLLTVDEGRTVDVYIRVEPVSGVEIKLTFETVLVAQIDEIMIALTADPVSASAISVKYPKLLEVISVGNRMGEMRERAAGYVKRSTLSIKESHGGYQPIPLKIVNLREKRELIELPLGIRHEDIALLRPTVPISLPSRSTFRLSLTFSTSASEKYAYWSADRTVYLRSIYFDGRDLSAVSEHGLKVIPVPFLGALDRPDMYPEGDSGVVRIEVNGWVVQGQGVCILWY
jgi:hypothetical protein